MKYIALIITIGIIGGIVGATFTTAYKYAKENACLQKENQEIKIQLYEECCFRIPPDL